MPWQLNSVGGDVDCRRAGAKLAVRQRDRAVQDKQASRLANNKRQKYEEVEMSPTQTLEKNGGSRESWEGQDRIVGAGHPWELV